MNFLISCCQQFPREAFLSRARCVWQESTTEWGNGTKEQRMMLPQETGAVLWGQQALSLGEGQAPGKPPCPLLGRIRGLAQDVWRTLQAGSSGPAGPKWTPPGGPSRSSPKVLPPQVVEETQAILREYGFRFVRRGPIFVKGKGELLTFFLKGRDKPAAFPNGSSVTLPHQVVDNS